MSKRKKVSVLVAHNRHAFKRYRKIVPILTGTGPASCTTGVGWGVIAISGSAAGVEAGDCYISIDTSGTGTQLND